MSSTRTDLGSDSKSDLLAIREKRFVELFVKARDGDSIAYRDLLKELMELLEKYYKKSVSNLGGAYTNEVGDLVQETLVAIHNRRATFDPKEPFGPWLFAIARYKLIDFYRKRKREKPAVDWEALESTLIARVDSDDFSTHQDLEALLGELPEKQSSLLRMLKLEGKSVKEVSAQVGMSETALKVSVHRALKVLKLRIREELE